jgi:hypothetical protein
MVEEAGFDLVYPRMSGKADEVCCSQRETIFRHLGQRM